MKRTVSVDEKYKLVCLCLSGKKNDNEKYRNFKEHTINRLFQFMNEEKSLKNEAEVVIQLQKIFFKLEMGVNFHFLYKKNMISVGGAFSSGKTSFINSFINDKNLKLPEGLRPTTAIPTYIINDTSVKITGSSKNGGIIGIPNEIFSNIDHEYISDLEYNIRDLINILVISIPMVSGFSNICLVDTPGYNSYFEGDNLYTNNLDNKLAIEELEKSNSIVWIIDITVGVITRNDIDFINKIKDKKLYVLLNKSELVPETSRDEIINQIKNNLEDEGIIYEGISAYSSRQKKEFQFVKKSLNQFLSEENVEFNLCDEIKSEFKSIINLYYNAIKADKIGQEKLLSNVGKDIEEMYYKILKLEQPINAKKAERCLEIFKESSSKIIKQFSAIVIEYKNQLDELKNIEEEILNSLDEIFWK
jgi:GTPase SAR1 family protein